jgi:hypothetical protein
MKTANYIALAAVVCIGVLMAVSSREARDTIEGLGMLLAIAAAFLSAYFAPSILARQRGLDRGFELLVGMNLFLGWTVLFWLFCLLGAIVGQTREQAAFYRNGLVQMYRKEG